MSGNSPVDPYEVPEFTGSWCELDQRVKALSGASAKIVTAATDVHTTFGGLRAFYRAPEAEQLFAVTGPVRTTAQLIGSDLSVIAGALRTYAQDGQPLAQRLNELRAEAQAFRTGPAADDEWREDADLIDENLNRRNKIVEVWAAFQDVEKACHGKIVSLVGGTPLKTDDGSGKEGMYGYDAEVLKQAKSLPWGDAVEESTPGWQVWEHGADFVTGFAVDGVWATVVGLGTLAGFNGWDAAGDAWSGLATLGEGLGATIIFGVNSPFWTLPEDQLPARMRESRVAVKETGKALLAWDDWEAHPGRAAGAVTFNVLTTVFTGGAGGAAATTAKAGTVAKALSVAGKVSRVVDPMTYVFKGAGAGLSKLGDAMASLRNLGKIQVPPLPEGAIALPEGGYKLADGTLRLPEGSAMPEGAFAVPPRTVRLPEGTPIPRGAVDFGDGMVQLPRRGEVPAGAVAVQEGTVKIPAGATALPPDTVPLPGAGKDFFYNTKGDLFGPDGTLLQRGTDAKPETPPAQATPDRAPAPATNPSVLPPARQPALVGAGAADGARLGGDAGRVGTGLGDDALRFGDDAPGPVPDRTPGGGAGDNMPTGQSGNHDPGGNAGNHLPANSLDNDHAPSHGSETSMEDGGTPTHAQTQALGGGETQSPANVPPQGGAGAGNSTPAGSNGAPGQPLDPQFVAARIKELDDRQGGEGHAPGRHHYPDDQALRDRLGDVLLDNGGVPKVYGPNSSYPGLLKSENNVDPLTGTTVDGVTGGVHRVGPFATRFDEAADMVRADAYFRAEMARTGDAAVETPIERVLGPDAYQRLSGYYRDPSDASGFRPVDFEGGTIKPVYRLGDDGEYRLITMFANPAAGRHP
ncbi:hypothetical protein ACWD01_05485 [Streptomyces sp. NPDC002835]